MRKQDIKPGVVYAYQRGRSEFTSPEPIVFLAAPADGVLYDEPKRYGSARGPVFVQNQSASAKPGTSDLYGPTGYPAVKFGYGTPEDARLESLLSITLADFEAAATLTRDDGAEFVVITSLGQITGVYAEQVAAAEARQQADSDRRAQEQAARDAIRARAASIVAVLRKAGIKVDGFYSPFGAIEALRISLDEAEKLTALLAERDAGECAP